MSIASLMFPATELFNVNCQGAVECWSGERSVGV